MALQHQGSLWYFLVVVLAPILNNSVLVTADCTNTSIGLENMYIIPNSSFTASSYFDSRYIPSNARLNGYNGWGPATPKLVNEYLQVDLGYPNILCAIATQGRSTADEWVTEYRVMTSVNGKQWTDYKENSKIKLFPGNTDRNTVVKNTLRKPLARYVRIYPTKSRLWDTMRVGLFGYPETCDNLPLGMESNLIEDITASSGQNPATTSRLHYTAGPSWCAAAGDTNPHLQIDLGSFYLICAVATQGNNRTDQWVKTYQIDISTDGTAWTTYQENKTDKVFVGNFDRSTVVRSVMFHGTVTRYIRIVPKEFQSARCLRVEIYGYHMNETCASHSLGIPSDNTIPNYRLTATSYYNPEHRPYMARLGLRAAWGPIDKESYDFLQIDLGAVNYMCSIASQGNGNPTLYEWITKYQVLYSTSNKQWLTYMENGTNKDFLGNTDQSTIVTNSIQNLFEAKFIRILPKNFNRWKSIRLDLKGLPAACASSLGLENSHIPNSKITSSSSLDSSHTASHGRLYGSSSWCSSSSPGTKYIQVDLEEAKTVTGVATQGDKDLNQWVTTYKVSYSFNNRNWNEYTEGSIAKIFDGNYNSSDVVVNWLSHPIVARYVRIFPQTSSGGDCLRLDLYGCTYYIPKSLIDPFAIKKTSATLQWKDITTHEGKAQAISISVSDTAGMSHRTFNVSNQPTSKEVTNLKPYTEYDVKIIGRKTDGRPLWHHAFRFQTLIAEPEASPTITLTAKTSQSINVKIEFTQMDKINGPMAGYKIFYQAQGGEKKHKSVRNVPSVLLPNLQKYTLYTISASVRNSKYDGPESGNQQHKTLEDVPEIGPQISDHGRVNVTSYQITWTPLTVQQSNGILTKYEVIWNREIAQTKESCKTYLTASTQGSNFVLQNLKKNEKYTVVVRGYTSVGPGPNSTAVSFLTTTSETRSSASSLCSGEGNDMTLSCLISNEPGAKYTWTKNAKTVDTSNSAFKIEGHKLIVTLREEEDFGMFECNVTNNEGTVVFTTNRYELKKCSQFYVRTTQSPPGEPQVLFYIIPLAAVIVFLLITIAFLVFKLRGSQRQNIRPNRVNDEARVNLAVEEVPGGPPGEIGRDDGPHPGGNAALYDFIPSGPVQEEGAKSKENYMELKTRNTSEYASLHRGERAESQDAEQRYEAIPGYENVVGEDRSSKA